MHDAAYEAVKRFSNTSGLDDIVEDGGVGLDLGGRDVNGTAHDLFPKVTWTVLDIEPHPTVDIVADVTKWWPPVEGSYDLVLSTEAIEHIKDWGKIIEVGYAALADEGYMVVTGGSLGRQPHSCIGHVPVPEGEHYRNVGPAELWVKAHAVGFSQIYVEFNPAPHHDVYMLAQK